MHPTGIPNQITQTNPNELMAPHRPHSCGGRRLWTDFSSNAEETNAAAVCNRRTDVTHMSESPHVPCLLCSPHYERRLQEVLGSPQSSLFDFPLPIPLACICITVISQLLMALGRNLPY